MEDILNAVNVVLSNGEGVDVDTINSAQQILNEIQDQVEGLQWSMEYLSAPGAFKPAMYAIIVIKYWVCTRWPEIAGLEENLFHILFDNSQRFTNYQRAFKYILFKAQAYLVINTYLNQQAAQQEGEATLFQKLLSNNTDMILSFLEIFFNELKYNQEVQMNILSMMSEDGSSQYLLGFILNEIQRGRSECIALLVDILTWVNPVPILEHPAWGIIIQNIAVEEQEPQQTQLTNEDEEENEERVIIFNEIMSGSQCENSLKVVDGLLGAPMDLEFLVSFIQSNNIIDILPIGSENTNICSISGTIISSIGSRLLLELHEIPEDWLGKALELLPSENECIAETVLPFIKKCLTPSNPQINGIIAETTFKRYIHFFESGPLVLNDFSEDLLQILIKIHRLNPEIMDQIFQSDFDQSLPSIAALFHVMQQIKNKSSVEYYITTFSYLLENCSIPASIFEYLALTQYIEFIIKKTKEPSILQVVFELIVNHAACAESPEEFAPKFSSILQAILKVAGIVADPTFPIALIATGNLEYIITGAKMIRCVPAESQKDVLLQCQNSLDEYSIFVFIEALPPAKNQSYKESVMEFMKVCFEKFTNHSRLISSIWNLLAESCFEIFCSLIEQEEEVDSIAQLCLVGYYLVGKTASIDWIPVLYNRVSECLETDLISRIDDFSDCIDEVKQVKSIIIQYFKFSAKVVHLIEDPSRSIHIALNIIENIIHVVDVSYDVLSFILSLQDEIFSSNIEEILVIIQHVLSSVVNEQFNPNDASWRKMLRQGMKIQGRIYLFIGDGLYPRVAAIISGLCSSDVSGLMDEWNCLMSRNVCQIDSEVGEFFNHFFQLANQ